MKICPTCNAERPRSDFKRRATLRQTRGWLKNPKANTRLMYEGRSCNACAAKKKRGPKVLTPTQLRKHLVTEGVKPMFYIEAAEAERRARGKSRQTEGGILGMKRKHHAAHLVAGKELRGQIETVRLRLAYITRTNGGRCAAHAVTGVKDIATPKPFGTYVPKLVSNPNTAYAPTPEQTAAAIAFLKDYQAVLIHARDKQWGLRKTGHKPMPLRDLFRSAVPTQTILTLEAAYASLRGVFKDSIAFASVTLDEPKQPTKTGGETPK